MPPLDQTACRLPFSSSRCIVVVLNERLLEVMGGDVTQEQVTGLRACE